MGRDVFTFYRECFARAFRGRFWQIEKWTGGLTILLLIVSNVSTSDPKVERLIETTLPLYFFVAAFVGTAAIGFLNAPVQMHREEREAREALEDLRKPRLKIVLPRETPLGVDLSGHTSESYGGNRFTNVSSWTSMAIYLLVTNLGETEAKRCRARVLWASRQPDDADAEIKAAAQNAGIIEGLELPWSKTDTNCLSTDIAAGDTARVWVAGVRSGGNLWVFRDIADLPIHYQRVFGDQGRHLILLQIDSDNVAPTRLLLSIATEEAQKPEKDGAWEPKATVTLLAQGGMDVEHPDLPKRVYEGDSS